MDQKPIDSFSGEFRFLSNFYPAPVEWGGLFFPTTEHAYVAAKLDPAIFFKPDEESYFKFCKMTASQVKAWGREIILRKDWDKIKFAIMEDLLRQKFQRGTVLAQKLLNTGDRELIEGNHWGDIIWGVCNGVGENRLGKLLMEIREDLKDYEE